MALSFSVAYGNQGGKGIYEYKLSKTSRIHRAFIFRIGAKIENKGNALSVLRVGCTFVGSLIIDEKMREETIEIRLQKGRIDELAAQERRGMDVALAAARKAYAPYSEFHVGAAVELEDGRLVPGSNQENAAYPSGLCAERTALFTAGAQYPDVAVRALYVVAVKDGVVQDKISPCGGVGR